MLTYTIRRLVLAIPTLLFISLVIFLLLELAPGDPMAQVPLTVPPDVKERMREALGLGDPVGVSAEHGEGTADLFEAASHHGLVSSAFVTPFLSMMGLTAARSDDFWRSLPVQLARRALHIGP